MKAFAFTLLLLTAALLTGCETDLPPEKNRENPIQRGIRGEGSATQRDFSEDPFVREETRSSY